MIVDPVKAAAIAIQDGSRELTGEMLRVVIEAHRESPGGNCLECRSAWPCDAAVVAAVLARERQP